MARVTKRQVSVLAGQVAELYGYDAVAVHAGSKINGTSWSFHFMRNDSAPVVLSSWEIPCWTAREAYHFMRALEVGKSKLSIKEEA